MKTEVSSFETDKWIAPKDKFQMELFLLFATSAVILPLWETAIELGIIF